MTLPRPSSRKPLQADLSRAPSEHREPPTATGSSASAGVARKAVSWLIAAGLGAVAVLAFQGRRSAEPPEPSESAPALQAQSGVDPQELMELRHRLARLEAQGRMPAPPSVATQEADQGRAEAPEDQETPRDPEVLKREREIARWMEDHYTPEVQGRVFGRYFAEVDRVRSSEPRDAAWASQVRSGLQDMLRTRSEFGRVSVEQLDCGSTLCRAKLDVGNPSQRGALVRAMQGSLHLDEASAFMPAGESRLEAYFAREGATLPLFDQVKYVSEEMDD